MSTRMSSPSSVGFSFVYNAEGRTFGADIWEMSAPQKLHLVTGTSKWMLAAASTSKCAGDKQPVRRGPSLTSPCLATGATPIRRNTYGDLDVTPAPDLLAGLTDAAGGNVAPGAADITPIQVLLAK